MFLNLRVKIGGSDIMKQLRRTRLILSSYDPQSILISQCPLSASVLRVPDLVPGVVDVLCV